MMCLPDGQTAMETYSTSGEAGSSGEAVSSQLTDSSAGCSITSPRKNKRKSMEPRKFHLDTPPATPDTDSAATRRGIRRRRLNSTGSDENHGSPENSESRTPSPVQGMARSGDKEEKVPRVSPLHIAPKKRFKLEAMKELQRIEKEESLSSVAPPSPKHSPSTPPPASLLLPGNPFRPWNESDSETRIRNERDNSELGNLPALMLQHLNREMQMALLSAAVNGSSSGISPISLLATGAPGSFPFMRAPPESLSNSTLIESPSHHLSQSPLTPPIQDEPLSLVKKKPTEPNQKSEFKKVPLIEPKRKAVGRKGNTNSCSKPRGAVASPRISDNKKVPSRSTDKDFTRHMEDTITPNPPKLEPISAATAVNDIDGSKQQQQRNYKNLTRARRIEANARERQRVHTITAAFDTLQAAIPTPAEQDTSGVKLSKLSVIKIATAYIMALGRMAGYDYTEDQSNPSLEEVMDNYRQVVVEETKVKTRKS